MKGKMDDMIQTRYSLMEKKYTLYPLEASLVLVVNNNASTYIISFLSTLHKQEEPTNSTSSDHFMEIKQYYMIYNSTLLAG